MHTRRDYLSVLGAGSLIPIAGCTDQSSGTAELIEDTFEGDGESLKEIEIQNTGPIFAEIECEPEVSVEVIPESEDANGDNFKLSDRAPSARLLLTIEPGVYALDIATEGSWTLTIEQHPVVQSSSLQEPDYPVGITGERRDVYGPYLLNGFLRVTTETSRVLNVMFIDNSGKNVKTLNHDSTLGGPKTKSHDPINLDGVYWIEGRMRLPEHSGVDNINYSISIEQPE